MSTPLRELFAEFRNSAQTEREKGNYFERLAVAFIKNDHGMAQEYEDCWLYSEWAAAHGLDGRDIGIDAVAKIRDEDSYCAIQCKFYREGHRIQKADIDSFFTASGKKQFSRRLIIDTTDAPWSANAESAMIEQDKPSPALGWTDLKKAPSTGQPISCATKSRSPRRRKSAPTRKTRWTQCARACRKRIEVSSSWPAAPAKPLPASRSPKTWRAKESSSCSSCRLSP